MEISEETRRAVGLDYPILAAWMRRRTKEVRELERQGKLVDLVRAVEDLLADELVKMLRQGVEIEAAQEMIQAKWMEVPRESEHPEWSLESLL